MKDSVDLEEQERLFALAVELIETAVERYRRMHRDLMSVIDSESGRAAWFEVKHLPRELAHLRKHVLSNKQQFLQAGINGPAFLADSMRTITLTDSEGDEDQCRYARNEINNLAAAIETGDADHIREVMKKYRR